MEDGWILLDPTDDTTVIRALSSDYLAGGGDGYFQTVPEDRIEILDELGITQLFMYYCSLQSELLGPRDKAFSLFGSGRLDLGHVRSTVSTAGLATGIQFLVQFQSKFGQALQIPAAVVLDLLASSGTDGLEISAVLRAAKA